jgi:NADP-dependent 3-hydroxy acid dehydrogenase YdfG
LIARSEENVRNISEKLDPARQRADWFVCDVREEQFIVQTRDAILQKMGRVDILVTCAAAPAAAGRTEELDFRDWRGCSRRTWTGFSAARHLVQGWFDNIMEGSST